MLYLTWIGARRSLHIITNAAKNLCDGVEFWSWSCSRWSQWWPEQRPRELVKWEFPAPGNSASFLLSPPQPAPPPPPPPQIYYSTIFPTSREQRNIVQLCTDFFAPFKQNRSSILYLIKSTWSDFSSQKPWLWQYSHVWIFSWRLLDLSIWITGNCVRSFWPLRSMYRFIATSFVDSLTPHPVSEWVSEQRCKQALTDVTQSGTQLSTHRTSCCSLQFSFFMV